MSMKKVLLATVILFGVISQSMAKDEGNISLFKDVKVLNYVGNFNSFKIAKTKAELFIGMKLNMDYEKFTNYTISILIDNANEISMKEELKLTNDENSDVQLVITPLTADKDGENTIECSLVYKPTNVVISTFELNSNGGDNDNFEEEFMKSVGKNGKKLGKQLIKIKKKAQEPKVQ